MLQDDADAPQETHAPEDAEVPEEIAGFGGGEAPLVHQLVICINWPPG